VSAPRIAGRARSREPPTQTGTRWSLPLPLTGSPADLRRPLQRIVALHAYSTENVKRLRKLGVRDIGLAPLGRAPWEVEGKVKARLIRERAMVEGSIGTIKCAKYGFNRPAARSAAMMGLCGQRAVLGLNLTKLYRGVAGKKGIALAV